MGRRIIKWDPQELTDLYWQKQLATTQIAILKKTKSQVVYNAMKRLDIPLRNRGEARQLLSKQGKISGPAHPAWRGGRTKCPDGYILTYAPGHLKAKKGTSYVYEHILIWEKIHNKSLPHGWVVHHLNGLHDDNRPENLAALPSRKHSHILAAKARRIRTLELEIDQLKKALEANQAIFYFNDN